MTYIEAHRRKIGRTHRRLSLTPLRFQSGFVDGIFLLERCSMMAVRAEADDVMSVKMFALVYEVILRSKGVFHHSHCWPL